MKNEEFATAMRYNRQETTIKELCRRVLWKLSPLIPQRFQNSPFPQRIQNSPFPQRIQIPHFPQRMHNSHSPQRMLCAAFFILHSSFFIFLSFFISSCTSEVDDTFPQSASVRLQDAMERAKDALASAEYGWELEYYPGSDLAYGGVIYTIRFDGQRAAVQCSLVPGQTETSLYKVSNDQGPVLSFDTYNSLLHYYATPSSAEYEAKGGDFEFIIDSVGQDAIKLRAKKAHQVMYLRRLNAPADGYADQTVRIFDHFADSIRGIIGSIPVKGKFDLTTKSLALTVSAPSERTFRIPFAFTSNGIRLYAPVTIGGVTIHSLAYDIDTRLFTAADQAAATSSANPADLTLQGVPYGADYMSYPMYEGDYTLVYDGNKSVSVTLVPNRLEGNYRLRGLSGKYELIMQYHPADGTLTLGSQQVGEKDGNPVYFVCYDADQTGGGLSLIDEQQFTITWNKNRFYPVYTFSATNPKVNNCNSSLLIYLYYGDDDTLTASLVDDTEWLTAGTPQLRNIKQLNKKSRIN